jgi:hypothetical protein
MWITLSDTPDSAGLHVQYVRIVVWCISLITCVLFTACRLDFWPYLCYNSIIQKNKEADSMSLANNPQQEDEPSE